jgi:hypothetical protein
MKGLIESETVRTFMWFAVALIMIVMLIGIIYLYGVRAINIAVG